MTLLAAENRAGFMALADEIGWWGAFRIGAVVEARRLRGEPFSEMAEPSSEDEAKSRRQMAPAVLLYDELCDRRDASVAYEITEEVVTASAVRFLEATVGRLRREELLGMEDDERQAFVRRKGEKFHNAELRWDAIESDRVHFTVTRCHFVELCDELGVPELATVFCAGDGEFFGGVEDDVHLERETTLAKGGESCPFHIRLE